MNRPIRILLQTTIPNIEDDWCIDRFSLLAQTLASITDEDGNPMVEVTARNREVSAEGYDPLLASLDRSQFDELWLFAVDTGDGLSGKECEGISRFRSQGGGILTTRDHENLGMSLCTLGGIGAAHHFHSKNQEPDPARHTVDDPYTTNISWPNYHSGANGDYQSITPVEPLHPVLANTASASGAISYLPAHPHEGAVGVPPGEEHARVIATGRSSVTGAPFNIAVAFESADDGNGNRSGRAIADSSFHHFCDYNWDPSCNCPSFVTEPPGDAIVRDPNALADAKAYVRNLALWLAPTN